MTTWYWTAIRIALGVVFVAALFFKLYQTLEWDLIGAWRKRKDKGAPQTDGAKAAFDAGYAKAMKERVRAKKICEGFQCVKSAEDSGALIESGGVKKIVCADCLELYVKTGWKIELDWREDNKREGGEE